MLDAQPTVLLATTLIPVFSVLEDMSSKFCQWEQESMMRYIVTVASGAILAAQHASSSPLDALHALPERGCSAPYALECIQCLAEWSLTLPIQHSWIILKQNNSAMLSPANVV